MIRSPTCLPSGPVTPRRQGKLVERVDTRQSTLEHRRPVLREEPAVEAPEHTRVPKVVDNPAADNRERVQTHVRRATPNPRKTRDRIDTMQISGERVDSHIAQLHVTLIRPKRRRRPARTRERRQSQAAQQGDRQGQRPNRPPGATVRPPRENRGSQRARRTPRPNGKPRARSTSPSSPAAALSDSKPAALPEGYQHPLTATHRLRPTHKTPSAEHQTPRHRATGPRPEHARRRVGSALSCS